MPEWSYSLSARTIRYAVDEIKEAMASETTLASIADRLPALVGGRIPVSIPAGASGLTDGELRASPLAVTGTFWQATQPVSAASLPLPSGAATATGVAAVVTKLGDGTTHVIVDSMPAGAASLTDAQLRASAVPVSLASVPTHAVTGPLTNTELRATAVPVSGTFYQATQPVSLASQPLPTGASTEATLAAIKAKTDNLDVALSTRAVTGLTDTQLRAVPVPVSGTVAVTGTFFQATQPVSGPLTDAQLRANAVAVTGTFWQATQPVSAAALPLPSGASTEATLALIKAKTDNLDVALSTRAVTGLTDVQLRASAVSVQEKDNQRVRCIFKFHAVAPGTVDTLLTLTKNLAGVETTGTSFAVTSGKRLRITAVKLGLKANAAAAAWATATLRHNAGAVVIGSPSIIRLDTGLTAAAINATVPPAVLEIPDGFEFSGTDQLGVSLIAQAVTNIISLELIGYEYTP